MNEQKIAPVLSEAEVADLSDQCAEGGDHYFSDVIRRTEQAVLARVGAVRDQAQEDAAALLGKYRTLCVDLGRGDGYHLGRIDDAIRALKGTPAAGPLPKCLTCGDRGEVGGFVGADSGYQVDPCPDCMPAAAVLPDPHGCRKCQHPDCGRYDGPRSVECRAMSDNACAREYGDLSAKPAAAVADERLSSLLRGLEAGPGFADAAPGQLFLLGQAIASQAKRANPQLSANPGQVADAQPVGHVSRDASVAHMSVNLPEGTRLYAAQPSAQAQPLRDDTHAFKNFHRSLCERFGYTHDEIDWRRDQVSLIEHIAAKAQPSGNTGELDALENAVLNLNRYEECRGEGGGVYETEGGDFVKVSDVRAAIAASKGANHG